MKYQSHYEGSKMLLLVNLSKKSKQVRSMPRISRHVRKTLVSGFGGKLFSPAIMTTSKYFVSSGI